MQTSLRNTDQTLMPVSANVYKYDQLNRLVTVNNVLDNVSSDSYSETFEYDPNGNIMTLLRNDQSGNALDNLHYTYNTNNRLQNVIDAETATTNTNDFEGNVNYSYDEIGNLISADDPNQTPNYNENIQEIKWNVQGKITEVIRDPLSGKPNLEFKYDPLGNRVIKIVKPDNEPTNWRYTFYRHDAQGNLLATYEVRYDTIWKLIQTECYMYGSSRLGRVLMNRLIGIDVAPPMAEVENYISYYFTSNTTNIDNCSLLLNNLLNYSYKQLPVKTGGAFTNIYDSINNNAYLLDKVKRRHFTMQNRQLGKKEYELTNHLGNVLAVITDRKIQVQNQNNTSLVDYFLPDVISVSDYYPGGFSLPGRSFSINSYPFGYQGSQKDNEIYGDGNAYTTYFRELDVRLGRWFTIDPKSAATPWESPYVSMGDNPIVNNDPNGDLFGTRWGSTSAQRKAARTEANKTKSKIHHFLKKDIHVDYHAGKKDYDIDIMTDINGQQVVARSLIIRPEDQYFLPNGDKVTHDDQKLYSSEHSLDAWFNKKIGGNDNIEYKGYAATELTPKQGSKVLGALGCVAGGTGFVVDGGIIAYSLLFASVTTTSNDLSRGKDDRGFIEKSINNPTGENVYKKIEMVLNIYGVASGTMDAFKSTGAVSKGLSTASAIYGIPGLPLPKK